MRNLTQVCLLSGLQNLYSCLLQSLKRCGKLQLWSPHGDLIGIMYLKTEVRFAASEIHLCKHKRNPDE